MEKHDGYGIFPLFKKGTVVINLSPYNKYPHWISCIEIAFEWLYVEMRMIELAGFQRVKSFLYNFKNSVLRIIFGDIFCLDISHQNKPPN